MLAAAVTGLSLLVLLAMTSVNRRKGWKIDPDRPRPAVDALNRIADTADRTIITATRAATRRAPPRTDPNTHEPTVPSADTTENREPDL